MEQDIVSKCNEAFDYWCNILGKSRVLNQDIFNEYKNLFIDNGMWIDDIMEHGKWLKSGYESDVYVSYTDHSMLLKVKIQQYTKTLVGTLIAAKYHNLLFPETFYTLVGFNDYGNSVYPVLKQSLIVGRSCNNEELDERLESLGLKKNLGVFTKDGYIIDGLHRGNVMVGRDEKTYVIDCNIRRNN